MFVEKTAFACEAGFYTNNRLNEGKDLQKDSADI